MEAFEDTIRLIQELLGNNWKVGVYVDGKHLVVQVQRAYHDLVSISQSTIGTVSKALGQEAVIIFHDREALSGFEWRVRR